MTSIDVLYAFASLFCPFCICFMSFFRFRCTFTVRSCCCCLLLVPLLAPPANQLWHFICCAQVDPLSFVCLGKKVKKKENKKCSKVKYKRERRGDPCTPPMDISFRRRPCHCRISAYSGKWLLTDSSRRPSPAADSALFALSLCANTLRLGDSSAPGIRLPTA